MEFLKLKKNLSERGYLVSEFETGSEAVRYLDQNIDHRSVGIGGSMTVEQLGLYDALKSHNQVFWHYRIPEGKTDPEIRQAASLTDIYISSVNGLAETGEIINIDGKGNRVAAMLYGHKKLYLLVGENKISEDYDRALYRARNVAAPKNAARLQVRTPCAIKADRCYDCRSPQRICRALSVLWDAPSDSDIEVVLIHEPLGF